MMDKLLYRIEEVCHLTGLGRTKVYDEIKTGRLRVVHFGKSVRIPTDELDAYIQRTRQDQRVASQEREAEAAAKKARADQQYSVAVCSICNNAFDWRAAGLKRHPKSGFRTYCRPCRGGRDAPDDR